MVGHVPLEDVIGVQIPVSQPNRAQCDRYASESPIFPSKVMIFLQTFGRYAQGSENSLEID